MKTSGEISFEVLNQTNEILLDQKIIPCVDPNGKLE